MPDGSTGFAIVHRVGSLRVEIWRLEKCGGEVNRVLQGQFAGVQGLRIKAHGPLFAIDGMAETGDKSVVLKQAATPNVAEDVAGLDFVGGVVAPGLRITDSYIESCELGLRFSFGRRSIQGRASMRRRKAAMMFATMAWTWALASGEK